MTLQRLNQVSSWLQLTAQLYIFFKTGNPAIAFVAKSII